MEAFSLHSYETLAAGASAALVIGKLISKGVKKIKRIIGAHLERINKIDEIFKEIKPNGGGSLRDSMNRVEAKVELISHRQMAIEEFYAVPTFETDSTGAFSKINRALSQLLMCRTEDILGFNWKNFIKQVDVTRFSEAFSSAIEDKRNFKENCTIVTADGEEIHVIFEANYVKATNSWLGFLARVN